MQATPEVAIAPSALPATLTLDVGGMKCAGCVKAVEKELVQYPGVRSATVNLVTEMAVVECEAGAVDPKVLSQKLTEAGFPTQPRWIPGEVPDGEPIALSPAERQRQETKKQIQRAAIAITLLILSAIGHLDQFGFHIPGLTNIWFHWGLATLALLFPGRSMLVDGWRGLRRNSPNMNTLVGLGTLTAYIASDIALFFPQLGWECFFDEPVMLVGFILLGRALEQHARGKAATAFQSLLDLQPSLARLIPNPQSALAKRSEGTPNSPSVQIPADRVRVGEWLQVLPGEKIPVDGEVVAGQTTIDESMLTGEAMPVLKQPGELVAAGTLNQSGAIAIKATRTGKETTLAQIIALVESAQTRKAPIQHLADVVAGYFTYGVMTISTVTFLFWYFVGTPRWGDHLAMASHHTMHMVDPTVMTSSHPLLLSLKIAIAVLVVACPCALGLATPTAILVGSGIGAEKGLLIRGGDVLEKVHHLTTIVFDKTGTLTTGHPTVTDCLPTECWTAETLLQISATVESGTRHPLAQAIVQQAQQQGLALLPAQNFHTESGLGVAAQVSEQQVILGTQTWLERHNVVLSAEWLTQAETLATQGKTIAYVAIDGTFAGLIAVLDTLRSDAKATVDCLKKMGLQVKLLTGDQAIVAEAIAQDLGLPMTDVMANVRPDGKANAIAQLQQQGQLVAMVGDGINDAPALAQADVSISMYSSTDVAVESAEIILMRDRLIDVVESIRLSRATFNKIRQNLFWAFAYNTLGIPVAAGLLLPSLGIVLSPATAGAFMAFSSLSVVTNSLLLRQSFFSSKKTI